MILINLNHNNVNPLYHQVISEIKLLIDNGALKPGEKLPSTRSFAAQLGVNRATIYKAYEELWAMGYIESNPGSYSIVRERVMLAEFPEKSTKNLINWDLAANNKLIKIEKLLSESFTEAANANEINFLSLYPDPKLYPVEEFQKCFYSVLRKHGRDLLGYGDIKGYYPLREFITNHLRKHSIQVTTSQILIINGIQNGLELILKYLVHSDKKILIEKPSYSSALPLFHYYNESVIEIPMSSDGIDLLALKKIVEKENIAFLYTMPNFQNPTGITTSQDHREKLIEICELYKIPIVEDGFEEEMKYFGKNILPIKSIDKHNIVLYMGTFSKVLFPGLRIGWIAADEKCIQAMSMLKKIGETAGNCFDQGVINQFCREGYYDKQIKRIQRVYKKRMLIALKELREHCPLDLMEYYKPNGGYTIWFELKNNSISENELVTLLRKNGVVVSKGSNFSFSKLNKLSFRISIAHCDELKIAEGIHKIISVIKSIN